MDYDKNLADVPNQSKNRSMLIGALVVVALLLLLVLGLLAGISIWILSGMFALVASGVAVMLWPSREEREATAWWNGLSKPEREKWLTQGGAEMHLGAWKAYKLSRSLSK